MNLNLVYSGYKRSRIQDSCKKTAARLLQHLTDSRHAIVDSAEASSLVNFAEDFGISAEDMIREIDQQLPTATVKKALNAYLIDNDIEDASFVGFTELCENYGNWDALLQHLDKYLSTAQKDDLIEGISIVTDNYPDE